jgi:hypothetical protein
MEKRDKDSLTVLKQRGTERFFHRKCWTEFRTSFYSRMERDLGKSPEGTFFNPEQVADVVTNFPVPGKCYWCNKRL